MKLSKALNYYCDWTVLAAMLVVIVSTGWGTSQMALAQSGEVIPIVATQAKEKAAAGELTIIDIRSPEEWKQTGIAESAVTNSMHVRGFMKRLEEMTGGDLDAPVALICAVGGRSGSLSKHLANNGYTQVYDVVDGMLGSAKGKGWLDGGLPIRRVE